MTSVPLPIGFLSAWKLMPDDTDCLMTLVEPNPADYIEHYGIQPSAEFLRYGRSSEWKPTAVDDAVILDVDRHLYELRSVGRDPGRELIE